MDILGEVLVSLTLVTSPNESGVLDAKVVVPIRSPSPPGDFPIRSGENDSFAPDCGAKSPVAAPKRAPSNSAESLVLVFEPDEPVFPPPLPEEPLPPENPLLPPLLLSPSLSLTWPP